MSKVISLVVIWLIIINVFAFFVLNRFNLIADTAYNWINPAEFSQNKNLNLIDLRVHWDSFWYLKIVEKGYEYQPGQLSSIAFFPLYPLLIWIFSFILPSPSLAGWIISTIALIVAGIFLYKLVSEFHPEVDPLESIILLLIFPTAFFLTSVYTESLFLALSIAFFYFLFKKKFLISAILLSLASLCRINGLFLFIPFIYEYFMYFRFKRFINPSLLSFLIAPLGIVSFMVYQHIQFGQPLAFLKAQMQWGREFMFNPKHFQFQTASSIANFSTDLLFLAIGLVTGFILLKRVNKSYGFYVLTTTLVATSTGTLMSIGRFVLILFPIFILIASLKSKEFKLAWMLLSTLLLAVFTSMFVSNYWAG